MPANTDLADVNEIYVAYVLNGGSFPDAASDRQFQTKMNLLNQQQSDDQMGRGAKMAEEFMRWATRNGYRTVEAVYWTARPGFSFKSVTGIDVDQRKNPTDILVKFRKGDFLGLSAKSTGGKGDIGFKNPGVGTVEKDLGIQISPLRKQAEQTIIEQFSLPTSASARKSKIRANATIQRQTDALGSNVLMESRDIMIRKLNTLSQDRRKEYIIGGWLDAGGAFPPYVKVTGRGSRGTYTAVVEDPLNNPKLTALNTGRITFQKVGNDSIGVLADAKKILKMRFKFESEKLASSMKMSGDPW